MKFTLSTGGAGNQFSSYGDGWVEINGVRHDASLVVGVSRAAQAWVADFASLDEAAFAALLDWQPEIVVFGSGPEFRFPHPRLVRALGEARVGFEAMDTRAACRTFNVLAGEGRQVVAAILLWVRSSGAAGVAAAASSSATCRAAERPSASRS